VPQASDELRARWNDGDNVDDVRATDHLFHHGFKVSRGGVIYHPDPNYKPTETDNSAIDYMLDEWDYAYDPNF
jgi:hypothetical protein